MSLLRVGLQLFARKLTLSSKVFISVCAVGLAWLWIVLPETAGVPLEEIAALFGQNEEVAIFSADFQKNVDTGELMVEDHAVRGTGGDHGSKGGSVSHHETAKVTV